MGNDLYARLTKQINCPFLPIVGLNIAFKLRKLERGRDADNYKTLVHGCSNSTGIVVVESVVYHPDGDADQLPLFINAVPAVEKSESEIAAYVRLMQDYYGFRAELFA